MHTWFECKATFDRFAEEGLIKRVTEPYLVDALTFAEAEERVSLELESYVSGEFFISAIKKAKIAELFTNEDGDKWYKSKINLITLDHERGIERKKGMNIMVQASSLKDAVEVIIDRMKGTMSDYDIASVTETQILDVFHYAGLSNEAVESNQAEQQPTA